MKITSNNKQKPDDTPTPVTEAEADLARYYGRAMDIARQALHSDERIMRDCIDRVQVRDAMRSENAPKSAKAIMDSIVDGATKKRLPLNDDQLDRAHTMAKRRIEIRDALVSGLMLVGQYDAMHAKCQRQPGRVAAVLQSQGVLGSIPVTVNLGRRRTLTEADHEQRAREADKIAAEICP